MIIAIWIIGIFALWIFTLLVFNERGYWIPSRFVMWCVVWSIAVAGYFLWGKI